MNKGERLLEGRHLNLSISGADNQGSPGYPATEVNALLLQLTQTFFTQGAGLVFGHDWREDGVMETVHGFAQNCGLGAEPAAAPRMINLVPWPDPILLPTAERDRLKGTLRVTQIELPEALRVHAATAVTQGAASPLHQYLRARGLTELRRALNRVSDARLCLGGPEASAGRYPGIVEEAYLAVTDGIPLYVSSVLGGAAAQVASAILQKEMPADFAQKTKPAALYRNPPVADRAEDARYEPTAVWRRFRELGVDGLSQQNGLSRTENEELLTTPVVERVIALVMIGIARQKQRVPGAGRAARG